MLKNCAGNFMLILKQQFSDLDLSGAATYTCSSELGKGPPGRNTYIAALGTWPGFRQVAVKEYALSSKSKLFSEAIT
jgi:hypothetical protein